MCSPTVVHSKRANFTVLHSLPVSLVLEARRIQQLPAFGEIVRLGTLSADGEDGEIRMIAKRVWRYSPAWGSAG